MDDIDLDDLFGEGENTLFDGMDDGFDLKEIGDEIMGAIDGSKLCEEDEDKDDPFSYSGSTDQSIATGNKSENDTPKTSSSLKKEKSKRTKKKKKSEAGDFVSHKDKTSSILLETTVVPPSDGNTEIKKKKKKRIKGVGVILPSMKNSSSANPEVSKTKIATATETPGSQHTSGSVISDGSGTKSQPQAKLTKRQKAEEAVAKSQVQSTNTASRSLKQNSVELPSTKASTHSNSSSRSHDESSQTSQPKLSSQIQKTNLQQLFERQLKQQQMKTAPLRAPATAPATQRSQSLALTAETPEKVGSPRRYSLTKSKSNSLIHSSNQQESSSSSSNDSNMKSDPSFFPFCMLPNEIHLGIRKYSKTFPLLDQVFNALVPGGKREDGHVQESATALEMEHNVAQAKIAAQQLESKFLAQELKEAHEIILKQRAFLSNSNDNMQRWCKVHFNHYDFSDIYGEDSASISNKPAQPDAQNSQRELVVDDGAKPPSAATVLSSSSVGLIHTTQKSNSTLENYSTQVEEDTIQVDFDLSPTDQAPSKPILQFKVFKTFKVKVKCTAFKPPFIVNPTTHKKQRVTLFATITPPSLTVKDKRRNVQTDDTSICMSEALFLTPTKTTKAAKEEATKAAQEETIVKDEDSQNDPSEIIESSREIKPEVLSVTLDNPNEKDWFSDYFQKLEDLNDQIDNENAANSITLWKVLQLRYLELDEFGGAFFSNENLHEMEDRVTNNFFVAGRKKELMRFVFDGLSSNTSICPNTATDLVSRKRKREDSYFLEASENNVIHVVDSEPEEANSTEFRGEHEESHLETLKRYNSVPGAFQVVPTSVGLEVSEKQSRSHFPSFYDRLQSLLVDEDIGLDTENDYSSDDESCSSNEIGSTNNEGQTLDVSALSLDERLYIQLRSANLVSPYLVDLTSDCANDSEFPNYCDSSLSVLHEIETLNFEATTLDNINALTGGRLHRRALKHITLLQDEMRALHV